MEMTREGMTNTTGRKWEMRYIYIHIFGKFKPKNKEKNREKASNPVIHIPKIDHKIPSTKDLKERCSKTTTTKRLEVTGSSFIIGRNRDRIMLDMRCMR